MPVERRVGRKCPGQLGFPESCSAFAEDIRAPCTAELRNAQCLVCVRDGDIPASLHWAGVRAYNIIATPNVQVLRLDLPREPWGVAVFLGGHMLDPRWPIVACRSKAAAIDVAMVRARHIEPYGRIEKRGDGDWRCGKLWIWVAG